MKNRREFLAAAAAVTLTARLHANTRLPQVSMPTPPGAPTFKTKLTVSRTRRSTIPANFIGLSYESQQLTDPEFFTPANKKLVAQFKALALNGVLRLGGNTSEFSWWKPTPTSTQPPRTQRASIPGEPQTDLAYPITPAAIDNLRKFLNATGWTCIYGLNLGNGITSPALVAEEAAYVAATLGPRLEYFQIGNEVDLFGRHIRNSETWNPAVFYPEWLTLARAVMERVPTAAFGAPDVTNHFEWMSAFSVSIASTPNPPKIAAITHHHYVGGPPDSPRMTIPVILAGAKEDKVIDQAAEIAKAAAAELKTAFRMTEGNTCYRGGKPGVSDVFAASLWSADYLLYLASLGYAGVNLHGGDAKAVANSLGGTLPGELLMKNPNEPHPKPFYTPIAHIGSDYVAEPVFYGMLFAGQFAGATLLDIDFNPLYTPAGSTKSVVANVTAFAALRPDGKTIVAIINKDVTNDVMLHLEGIAPSDVLRLAASAPDARDVTFARASVTPNGVWNPRPEQAVIAYKHNLPIRIPRASAALIVSR
ncbi:MAG: hypothetical protein P4L10_06925 [Acidobacteriaceae bacterium]|nr:hypothetical protein [Acidobacteriaceae bacterium]